MFYTVFLSVTLCSCDMQYNLIQIMSFPMHGTVFALFFFFIQNGQKQTHESVQTCSYHLE